MTPRRAKPKGDLVGPTVRLVHWKASECAARVERVHAAGFACEAADLLPESLRMLVRTSASVWLIDLSRLPMQGRDLALHLRSRKAQRAVPLVFVDGEHAKVARVKEQFPDATYCSWRGIRGALRHALTVNSGEAASSSRRGSAETVDAAAGSGKPASVLAGYSGTPLPKKLGIKPGARLGLLSAPDDVETILGALPPDVDLVRNPRTACDLLLWFLTKHSELARGVKTLAERTGRDGVWICWPKKASGVATDVTQDEVRRLGLAHGLVDSKIAAIDATWSGLKFAVRKG